MYFSNNREGRIAHDILGSMPIGWSGSKGNGLWMMAAPLSRTWKIVATLHYIRGGRLGVQPH